MSIDYETEWKNRLQQLLDSQDMEELAEMLSDMHGADLAGIFPDLEESQQLIVLETLEDEQAAMLLDELDADTRARVLDLLSLERTSSILEEMSSDDAADILGEMTSAEADAVMEHMESEAAQDVADLLRYSEDSAGGLMAKELVRLHPDQTVGEALAVLRRQHEHAEMIYDLYVVDDEDRLLGVVTLRKLIISDPDAAMSDIMAREYPSVHTDIPQDEVAEIVRRHDLLAVPVLDDEGRLQGIITIDDVGEVVQDEAAEDLLEISGSEEPEDGQPARTHWRGWRSGLLTLLGGMLAAVLVLLLWPPSPNRLLTAVLLPLFLVLGITISSQAALAMDSAYDSAVERHWLGRIFWREVLAGALLALIVAALSGGIIAVLLHRWDAIAMTIPLALGTWLASIAGALGAIIEHRRSGEIGPTAHTVIVVISLLAGIALYLVMTRWITALIPL
ncbi:MAG: magnesium transporter [Armatimonadota bacterium]